MTRIRSRLRGALALTVALAVPASALGAAVDVAPTVDVDRFQARVVGAEGTARLVWRAPDSYAVGPPRGFAPLERTVRDGGLETSRSGGGPGYVARRGYVAAPDGYTVFDLLDSSVDTLLARMRAGTTTAVAARTGGRATLRGTVRLGPNDCAGLRGGVRTIHLDARTLVPLRIVTRRSGSRTQTLSLTGLRVNRLIPAGTFLPVSVAAGAFTADQGFRRVSPAAAAARLPYVPETPAALPAGFTLAVSGWAPRGAVNGAEGSIPSRPALFAAVYARGVERIEVTQRRAVGGDWPGDPFAGECRPLTTRQVSVGGVAATYAIGPETGPHLYWRDGAVLHTVSGPFPADDLVAVAASLTPVTPAP